MSIRGLQAILRGRFFTVEVSREEQIVRVTRSTAPFASLEELERAWREIDSCLSLAGRRGRSLMFDLRLGPPRNDPAFEAAMRTLLPPVRAGFRRIGVLVRSAVGGLQVSRLARADGATEFISSSEDELLTYLREPDGP